MGTGETSSLDGPPTLDELVEPQKETTFRSDRVEVFQYHPGSLCGKKQEDQKDCAVSKKNEKQKVEGVRFSLPKIERQRPYWYEGIVECIEKIHQFGQPGCEYILNPDCGMHFKNSQIQINDKIVGPVGEDHRDQAVQFRPEEGQTECRIKSPEKMLDSGRVMVGEPDQFQNKNNNKKVSNRIRPPSGHIALKNNRENPQYSKVSDYCIIHEVEFEVTVPFSEWTGGQRASCLVVQNRVLHTLVN